MKTSSIASHTLILVSILAMSSACGNAAFGGKKESEEISVDLNQYSCEELDAIDPSRLSNDDLRVALEDAIAACKGRHSSDDQDPVTTSDDEADDCDD